MSSEYIAGLLLSQHMLDGFCELGESTLFRDRRFFRAAIPFHGEVCGVPVLVKVLDYGAALN